MTLAAQGCVGVARHLNLSLKFVTSHASLQKINCITIALSDLIWMTQVCWNIGPTARDQSF